MHVSGGSFAGTIQTHRISQIFVKAETLLSRIRAKMVTGRNDVEIFIEIIPICCLGEAKWVIPDDNFFTLFILRHSSSIHSSHAITTSGSIV